MGEAALGLVKQVTEFHENVEASPEQVAEMDAFEEEFGGLDYYYQRVFNLMDMLNKAIEEAGTTEPTAVAFALEGMTDETPYGTVTMREDNHQLLQPLFISTFSDEAERDVEGTGFGFVTDPDGEIPAEATRTETTCEMERPEQG